MIFICPYGKPFLLFYNGKRFHQDFQVCEYKKTDRYLCLPSELKHLSNLEEKINGDSICSGERRWTQLKNCILFGMNKDC